MNSESDVRANALHPSGVAAGINQLTTQTLPGVGWTKGLAAFAAVTAEQQLAFMRRFFLPATLQPDQGPETVLTVRGISAAA